MLYDVWSHKDQCLDRGIDVAHSHRALCCVQSINSPMTRSYICDYVVSFNIISSSVRCIMHNWVVLTAQQRLDAAAEAECLHGTHEYGTPFDAWRMTVIELACGEAVLQTEGWATDGLCITRCIRDYSDLRRRDEWSDIGIPQLAQSLSLKPIISLPLQQIIADHHANYSELAKLLGNIEYSMSQRCPPFNYFA